MPIALRQKLLLVALGALVLTSSCLSVPHKPYHKGAEPVFEENYSLAHIELDDQGSYWDDAQLDKTIELIDDTNAKFAKKMQRQGAGGIFVIFVHGWRNDASPSNAQGGNLFHFKEVLNNIGKEEKRMAGDKARPVVGIYVAWRGDSLKGHNKAFELFDVAFTFWGRNAAANRVASRTPATNTILLLLKTIRGSSEARSIVVGHSMGALIIERALSQALAGIIIETVYSRKSTDDDCPTIRIPAPADLVVMVNSAAPAFQAKDLVETFDIAKAKGCEVTYVSQPQRGIDRPPLLVSVTALNDRATKAAFPIGTYLGTQGQLYQYGQEPPQQYLATRTPGHTLYLHSHKPIDFTRNVERCGNSPSRIDLCESSENTLSFTVQDLEGKSVSRYRLDRYVEKAAGRKIFNRDSPYWIMNAPKEVINGHSDIFKQEFQDFLRGIILVTGAGQRGPGGSTLQIQEAQGAP